MRTFPYYGGKMLLASRIAALLPRDERAKHYVEVCGGSGSVLAAIDPPFPMDKAGAYAIQGLAAIFVTRLDGSYSGVMGLPLFETATLLRETGIGVRAPRAHPAGGERRRSGRFADGV